MLKTSGTPESTPKFPALLALCYPEKKQPCHIQNFGMNLIQNFSVPT
jgi:hypothetical protein